MAKAHILALCSVLALVSAPSWADTKTQKKPITPASASKTTCQAMVYVKVPSTTVNLKNQPKNNAKDIAQLRNRQYLCLIQNNGVTDDAWVQVKAVPFADGRNTLCNSKADTAWCNEMGNFPIVWLDKAESTKNCRLGADDDGVASVHFYTKGNCATGWLRKGQIHFFAD